MADSDPQTPKNLSEFVESVFQRLQDKFEAMSDQLTSKMEDMGARIDDMDRDVADLMSQAGIEKYDTDLEVADQQALGIPAEMRPLQTRKEPGKKNNYLA